MKTSLLLIVTGLLFFSTTSLQAHEPGSTTIYRAYEKTIPAAYQFNLINPAYTMGIQIVNKPQGFGCTKKSSITSFEKLLQWDFKLKWQVSAHMAIIFSYN